jgi:hypothetical protein
MTFRSLGDIAPPHAADRIACADWSRHAGDLDARGHAVIDGLLAPSDCRALAALYADESRFRRTVVMARHGYGRGEYRYFAYPLPEPVAELRSALYVRLAPVANEWNARLGAAPRYPAVHADFRELCHEAGQRRPTPLLLRYSAGDYNCLHQDLYGALVFPFQVAIMLSEPGVDFTGGEFLLLEQRPRRQSRADVVPLDQGDAVIFAVHHRPVEGPRGISRATMKHGVSRLRSGERYVAGIIFHDAT